MTPVVQSLAEPAQAEGDEVPDWLPQLTVEALHGKEPGADLAYLVDFGQNDDADDDALVEAVAAWQRMQAWAAAGAARAAAALAGRASMNPDWPTTVGAPAEKNVAGEELAMRLACSRRAARALVRQGQAYASHLAPVGDALHRGEIDPGKARLLVEALDRPEVPVELALDVQDEVLPEAAGLTPTELSRRVCAVLVTADPGGAAARARAARRGRRLDRPRVLPDGMAGVWAVLAAADAVRLDAGIDHLARSAREHGDPRTLDQLRADVLVDLTVGHLGAPGAGRTADLPGPAVPGGASGGGVQAPVPRGTEDEGTARATDGRADALAGFGAVVAGVAGVASRGGGTPGGVESAAAVGTRTSAAGCACGRGTARRAQIRVTVPLTTLAGLDDGPGEIDGYGPVTADAARLLAMEGTWRRIVTDPLSGAVLDVGRTRYRPPADLAEHIRSRDGTCARPGCPADAGRCDLDHTIEYRDGGSTSDENLGPLCPRDHTVKTDGGFQLTQPEPGRFCWVTPTGHVYEVEPGRGRARTHVPPRRVEVHDTGPDDEPPPF